MYPSNNLDPAKTLEKEASWSIHLSLPHGNLHELLFIPIHLPEYFSRLRLTHTSNLPQFLHLFSKPFRRRLVQVKGTS